jgi:hypothetical protein
LTARHRIKPTSPRCHSAWQPNFGRHSTYRGGNSVQTTGVTSQTLTECGQSEGYAYYFSGGLVPAGDGGWKKDGIDGGRIILNFINGEVDLLIKNATGTTASVKQDGGKIIVRKTNNGLIALTIVYEGETATTEEYVFQIDDRGDGMVASTAIRTAGKINKVSLMTASCRRPR